MSTKTIRNSSIELSAVEAASLAEAVGVQLLANDSDSQVLGKIGDALLAIAERARVVGVLDAWAARHPGWAWRCISGSNGRCCCEGVFIHPNREPLSDERFDCYGHTPDAARAAAAKAIEAGEV